MLSWCTSSIHFVYLILRFIPHKSRLLIRKSTIEIESAGDFLDKSRNYERKSHSKGFSDTWHLYCENDMYSFMNACIKDSFTSTILCPNRYYDSQVSWILLVLCLFIYTFSGMFRIVRLIVYLSKTRQDRIMENKYI